MALQAALLPSTLSVVPKKGSLAAVVKDTAAFLSVPHKKLQVPSLSVRAQAVATATAPVATPGASTSTRDSKKTLRQGVVVITGASLGLGLAAAKALAETGKWHVVMACRDFLKAAKAAKGAGMAEGSYTIMHLDLASLDSVRQFVDNFRRAGMPLDSLVCNAAIYRSTARTPTFTADGYEMSVGVNHLGHFLLAARAPPPRRPPEIRLPVTPPHHPRLHHGEHQHAGREHPAQGRARRPPRPRRRPARPERVGHDRRLRELRRRQGVQGQQDLQHAHHAGAPPPVPRGHGHHLRVALPGLHRHHGALPRAHPALPAALPAVPEVHHQGVRVGGGVRQEAGAGGERPQPHQVRGVLELEQGLRLLREPALAGGQRPGEGQEALGDQREARRTRLRRACWTTLLAWRSTVHGRSCLRRRAEELYFASLFDFVPLVTILSFRSW